MEKYRKIVKELNEKNLNAQKRVKRCHYLRDRATAMMRCGNPEQAEAYAVRIELHKRKLIDTLEEIERLEAELKKIPRTWIV